MCDNDDEDPPLDDALGSRDIEPSNQSNISPAKKAKKDNRKSNASAKDSPHSLNTSNSSKRLLSDLANTNHDPSSDFPIRKKSPVDSKQHQPLEIDSSLEDGNPITSLYTLQETQNLILAALERERQSVKNSVAEQNSYIFSEKMIYVDSSKSITSATSAV
jgi:hypothetical protein